MGSDESESDLPDLEEKSPSCIPTFARKRSDFYSDSSDVEMGCAVSANYCDSSAGCTSSGKEVIAQDKERKLASKQEKVGGKMGKQQEKEQKKLEKEKQKELREQLKQKAEFEKSKKRILQESIKNSRPGECLKHVVIVIDTCLLSTSCGPAIVKCLQAVGMKYEVDKLQEKNMICFWREVTSVTEVEPNKLETKTQEVVEDDVLIYIPLSQFIQLVDGFQKARTGVLVTDMSTLDSFVADCKSKLENRNVTLLVQGLENYLKQSVIGEKRAFKNRVMEVTSDVPKRKRPAKESVDATVTRFMVEEAALALQLKFNTCIKFLESDDEVAKTVVHYTKSVAEKPYKQELCSRQNSGYNGIFVEGCRSGTKVGSDGQGLARIWCLQLQQFKNVSAEVANAIAARYPSPRTLFEAYESCGSEKEKESLLEDIVVRRGAGIVSTVRRVGKELSRRLYVLMTSDNGMQVIK